jgi:hypothetical protein
MKTHYVYRISNIVLNRHYYGARSTKYSPKEDLGIRYFSSSHDKEFLKDQKVNPQNYKYKIIKSFSSREDAILLEIKLHNRFDVGVNPNFYNRSKQTSTGWDTTGIPPTNADRPWNRGIPLSNEIKEKISKTRKDRINKGLIIPRKGYVTALNIETNEYECVLKEEYKNNDKYQIHNKGKSSTEDVKKKISKAAQNREVLTCPHCEKTGQPGMMKRWHFDNCKENPNRIKKDRSPANKGKKDKRVICPHCGKEGGEQAMHRWHFDNCKIKKS